MTQPKLETVFRGGSRYYIHPETGESVPGVTSILNMRAKPFLMAWAAKLTAELAVDQIETIKAMSEADRQGAIDFLKGASKRFTRKAADVGTAAHGIFEAIALGEELGRVSDEMAPFRAHFEDFVEKLSPEFVEVEQTVWSEAHHYAGSFDAILKLEGKLVFTDWKTTRSGVHDDVAYQLAAYRHADVMVDDHGSVRPIPATDGAVVLHVRPEGWKLVPVDSGEETFAEFLALREIHRIDKEKKGRTLVGRPLWKGKGA